MRAVDVHGFGGGFTLAAVQAGFELAGKMSEAAGFGVYACLANRHLLGYEWESLIGPAPANSPNTAPAAWDVLPDIDLVFGNPPCSGFSTLSPKEFRGVDSTINKCMWQLVDYATRVSPPVVIWESVQQTFRQGLTLMRMLHKHLEEKTGKTYYLTHVLHNNASVGGMSNRKRYFWVASVEPFGVDHNRVSRDGLVLPPSIVPTLNDGLQDLKPLGLTMALQAYRGTRVRHEGHDDDGPCNGHCHVDVVNATNWCREEIHDGTGLVDGHQIFHSPTYARISQLLDLEPWGQGERMSDVMKRYWQRTGKVPSFFEYMTTKEVNGEKVPLLKSERLVETDFAMGHNQPARWHGDRPANVITGGGVHLVIHPTENRTLTNREVARIQGFPDDWRIWPIRYAADLGPAWGKGVPVQAGRWIARWARAFLEGDTGPMRGDPLSLYDKKLYAKFGPYDRERVIDLTYAYRPYLQVA